MKTGVLLHVYYLEIFGWDELMWGNPAKDQLGALTKFADCLLDIPADEEVFSIVHSGPSTKDGLAEGEYTRKYLLDRIKHLRDFPRLQAKIDKLSDADYEVFVNRLHDLNAISDTHVNHAAEIKNGAAYFAERGVTNVLQVALASTAPRCAKLQALARENGEIPKDQQWFLVMSETCFNGGSAADVIIREPAHRGDDPLLGLRPGLPEILQRFQYELAPEVKVQAVKAFGETVSRLANVPKATKSVLKTP